MIFFQYYCKFDKCQWHGAIAVTGCSPNPCLNGGTCDEVDSGFECTCESGFTGDVCEIPPSTSPCGGVDCKC